MGVVYAFSFANSERSMTPMRFDDHRKIVGTGFNTDPRDATEPDGRHAGIPFVVGARRVFSAVAGTDQDVHSYVFMLQVDKHERCSLEVLLAMPDWASISGDGSVHQEASANSDAYSAAVMQERSLAFVREVVLGASNRTCGRGMHCTCSSYCLPVRAQRQRAAGQSRGGMLRDFRARRRPGAKFEDAACSNPGAGDVLDVTFSGGQHVTVREAATTSTTMQARRRDDAVLSHQKILRCARRHSTHLHAD